jgi:hypothetical protein
MILKPRFKFSLEPLGKMFHDKNRTTIGNELSSRKERYAERILTFSFLLVLERIFSQRSTKQENLLASIYMNLPNICASPKSYLVYLSLLPSHNIIISIRFRELDYKILRIVKKVVFRCIGRDFL